jgi:hypothetical protein
MADEGDDGEAAFHLPAFLTHELTHIQGRLGFSSMFMRVKCGGSEWGSKAPANVYSTRYSATDGSFGHRKQCKAVLTAGEWQVVAEILDKFFRRSSMGVRDRTGRLRCRRSAGSDGTSCEER